MTCQKPSRRHTHTHTHTLLGTAHATPRDTSTTWLGLRPSCRRGGTLPGGAVAPVLISQLQPADALLPRPSAEASGGHQMSRRAFFLHSNAQREIRPPGDTQDDNLGAMCDGRRVFGRILEHSTSQPVLSRFLRWRSSRRPPGEKVRTLIFCEV